MCLKFPGQGNQEKQIAQLLKQGEKGKKISSQKKGGRIGKINTEREDNDNKNDS